jgi:hypothetical protein
MGGFGWANGFGFFLPPLSTFSLFLIKNFVPPKYVLKICRRQNSQPRETYWNGLVSWLLICVTEEKANKLISHSISQCFFPCMLESLLKGTLAL